MANYYELLSLSPSATAAEIQQQLDAQYDKWRRLTTHHDPDIAQQANSSLNTLEKIRETLLSPDKRQGYDEAIGVSGEVVSGLADPDALLKTMSAGAPLAPPKPTQSTSQEKRLDAWVCPDCETANRIGQMHCTSCGGAVGENCPACNAEKHVAETYCAKCGVDIEKKRRELEQKAEKREIYQRESEIRRLEQEIEDLRSYSEALKSAQTRFFRKRYLDKQPKYNDDLLLSLHWPQEGREEIKKFNRFCIILALIFPILAFLFSLLMYHLSDNMNNSRDVFDVALTLTLCAWPLIYLPIVLCVYAGGTILLISRARKNALPKELQRNNADIENLMQQIVRLQTEINTPWEA